MKLKNRMKTTCVLLLATALLILPAVGWTASSKVCTFKVEGMTCATCPLQVKTALKRVDGVREIHATLSPPRAKVAYDAEKTTVDTIAHAISDIGYIAKPIDCKE